MSKMTDYVIENNIDLTQDHVDDDNSNNPLKPPSKQELEDFLNTWSNEDDIE